MRKLVGAKPKIEQGILTLVLLRSTSTETGGLTIINELPQQCYFRLGHWNNTGLEAQVGQQSDVPLRVAMNLVLPLVTHLTHTL